MLSVKTPAEVIEIINKNFDAWQDSEDVSLLAALGRTLAEDIISDSFIPDFTRSTVDGFAVISNDTFGCSESIPSILSITETIKMGSMPQKTLQKACCAKIPTGGALPQNADAVVMLEYTEDYKDGSVGILKSVAPGSNVIYRGDDVKPGEVLLKKGHIISVHDIGSLAALGIRTVKVADKLKIGIISTGNELIPSNEKPKDGQIRNVNSDVLAAFALENNCKFIDFGIIKDEATLLSNVIDKALKECSIVLVSGGSSAGEKDYTANIIKSKGELLLHGIAIKPGKPTILGKVDNKAIFGLPGHPLASFFVAKIFVQALINKMLGLEKNIYSIKAILTENIASNHGRAQYGGVKLFKVDGTLYATPVHSKSGLITTIAQTEGYYVIDCECEGIKAGSEIEVFTYGI